MDKKIAAIIILAIALALVCVYSFVLPYIQNSCLTMAWTTMGNNMIQQLSVQGYVVIQLNDTASIVLVPYIGD